MIPLRKMVTVLDLVNGVPLTVTGQIVGVTREEHPRYDVMVNGQVIVNVPGERVREVRRGRDIFGVVK